MDMGLKFEKRDKYLLVTGEGERNDLTSITEGTKKINESAAKFGTNFLLIDYRNVTYNVDLPQAYNIVKVYESQVPEIKKITIAAVGNPKNMELIKFWESISNRRGFRYKVFTAIEDAEQWLLEEIETHAFR